MRSKFMTIPGLGTWSPLGDFGIQQKFSEKIVFLVSSLLTIFAIKALLRVSYNCQTCQFTKGFLN